MSISQITSTTQINNQQKNTDKLNKSKKKKSLISYLTHKNEPKIDITKYDPTTEEKIAQVNSYNPNVTLAKQEAVATASKKQEQPADWFHALKAGTVGTSGGFVASQLLGVKGRAAGLLSLGLGTAFAVMDVKKQVSNYNKQMGARELLIHKNTGRSQAYKQYLTDKYKLNNG